MTRAKVVEQPLEKFVRRLVRESKHRVVVELTLDQAVLIEKLIDVYAEARAENYEPTSDKNAKLARQAQRRFEVAIARNAHRRFEAAKRAIEARRPGSKIPGYRARRRRRADTGRGASRASSVARLRQAPIV